MEISGEIQGQLSIKKADLYSSTNEKMCTAVLKAKASRGEAAEFYGQQFDEMIFSLFTQEGDDITAGFKSISPNFVLEKHLIEILGKKISTKPEILKVVPFDGEEAVTLEIILPLPIGQTMRDFYGKLLLAVGTTVTVDFKREEIPIPGTEKGNGKLSVVQGSPRPVGSHGPTRRPG